MDPKLFSHPVIIDSSFMEVIDSFVLKAYLGGGLRQVRSLSICS